MLDIDTRWLQLMKKIEKEMLPIQSEISDIADYNQWKVLRAMQSHRLSDFHFAGSTGYGYNDKGREVLDAIYAEVFTAEAALVRPHFVSGTHAISTAMFGILRPGDECLFITGEPYDTLRKVIAKSENAEKGSLADWGITVKVIPLTDDFQPDWSMIATSMNEKTRVVAIQRSRGYEWRPSFDVQQISEMIDFVKNIHPDVLVLVDNCYGEFTEKREPTDVGADIVVGSLIKNPGGGIASTGGYVVGKKHYINQIAERLTAPGIGADVGAMQQSVREIAQGFFLAPHVVSQAMLGAVFAANLFEKLGLDTNPRWTDRRTDLIQAVRFKDAHALLAFVQSIQHTAPVDSHVTPEPWDMPGYEHPVVMAAGTFIQGGSLELTADAPLREPYIAYLQGGLTFSHVKYSLMKTVSNVFGDSLTNNLT